MHSLHHMCLGPPLYAFGRGEGRGRWLIASVSYKNSRPTAAQIGLGIGAGLGGGLVGGQIW